jgi:hypothetical protein
MCVQFTNGPTWWLGGPGHRISAYAGTGALKIGGSRARGAAHVRGMLDDGLKSCVLLPQQL